MTAKAARANTRTFTQNARRAQIVQASIETLAALGYAKTSFTRISQHAKLSSTGMISYHFSGKPELFAEVADIILTAAEQDTGARLSDAQTHRGKLRAYIASHVEFTARYPEHTKALTEIVTMVREGQIEGLGDIEHSVLSVERLVSLLEEGQQAGEFGTFDALTMALTIRGAIDNVLRHHQRQPDIDLDRCTRELTDTFDRCTRPD